MTERDDPVVTESDDPVVTESDDPVVTAHEPGTGLSRSTSVWLVAMFVAIVIGAVMGLVHLPYAILQPGPARNTLGNGPEGKPLITVAGKTYPTAGALDFTTVAVVGGPANPVNGWQWITARLDGTNQLVPEEELFPKGVTTEEVDHENATEMAESQQEAIAVALRSLGETVLEVVTVGSLTKTSPARGVLLPADILVSIDGKVAATPTAVRTAIRAHKPGETVAVTVRRGGKELPLTVRTTTLEGQAAVGVLMRTAFEFKTKVSINAGNVGGPSAGLMFALAVYDKLTPGALTGGAIVAGTGTINTAGAVGPIGAIRQKMVGAKRGKATWFLAPAANCKEVVGHVPEGIRVVKVATFTQARDAVKAIAAKNTASLPTCT